MIRIEAGCSRLTGNTWKYEYGDSEGVNIIVFTADPGVRPRIGDSIEGGVLIPLEGYIINDDHSKWAHHKHRVWGEG